MAKQKKNRATLKRRRPKAKPIFRAFRLGHDGVGTGMKQGRLPSEVEVQTQLFLRGGRLTARELAEAIHGLPELALAKLQQLAADRTVACDDAVPSLESDWRLTAERRRAPASINPPIIGA